MISGLENNLLLIAAIVNLFLGFVVIRQAYWQRANILYFLFALSVSSWAAGLIAFEVLEPASRWVYVSVTIIYLSAACILLFFALFNYFYRYPDKKVTSLYSLLLISVYLGIVALVAMPGYVIVDIIQVDGVRAIAFGPAYPIYSVYIVSFFCIAFLHLLNKYFRSEGLARKQAFFVLVGTLISALAGTTTNLILPAVGSFQYFAIGPIMTIWIAAGIGYAMMRHNLWNLRLATAEIMTFIITASLIGKTLLSETLYEVIVRGSLFAITAVFGYLLVRSVRKEVQVRTTIEALASQLQSANVRLRELDEQKSEFISIASHQLRTPLTAIKGYASMLLEGSFGKVPKKAQEPISTVFSSSQRLVKTVENFLALSRIEQGRMQYQFEHVDLKELVGVVVGEARIAAAEKGLTIKFQKDARRRYMINADFVKIRHAIGNLIDNSIQHTEQGLVEVAIFYTINKNIRLTVSDTGEGATRQEIEHFFEKYQDAQSPSNQSSFDLFVSKEIIDAHGGAVRAESQGPGHGITFFVEFKPMNTKKP